MDTIEVVQKGGQGWLWLWPDNKRVVHVSEPHFGFQGGRLEGLLFEVFHVEHG